MTPNATAATNNDGNNKTTYNNNTTTIENDEKIPSLCYFWIKLQRSLPIINFFGLNISLTIVSAIALTIVRYIGEYIMITIFHWPSNNLDTKLAASSIASIFHSINLVPTLYILLIRTVKPYYNPSAPMSENQAGYWWKECVSAMLQFCTGYMLYDSVVTFGYIKTTMQPGGINADDLMFLGHHLATTLYMSSTRWYNAGHQSAMMCMLVGEITNPFHNSYYIANYAQLFSCCNGSTSQMIHSIIEFVFAVAYILFRVVIGPIGIIHATYNLLTTGIFRVRELPIWLILIWITLMWAVLIGSIPWVIECWGYVLKPLPTNVATTLITIFGGHIPNNNNATTTSDGHTEL